MSNTEFRHTPKPPYIPKTHPNQHRFLFTHNGAGAGVIRFADEDRAQVQIEGGGVSNHFSCHALLAPAELRNLARALLDAAQYIEDCPAVFKEEEAAA